MKTCYLGTLDITEHSQSKYWNQFRGPLWDNSGINSESFWVLWVYTSRSQYNHWKNEKILRALMKVVGQINDYEDKRN